MREISSPDNPLLKRLTALSRKRERDRQERYVIEGPNLLKEALKNGVIPEAVFFRRARIQDAITGEYQELLRLLSEEADGAESVVVSDGLFDRAAQTETPQGVMAIVKKRLWIESQLFGSEYDQGFKHSKGTESGQGIEAAGSDGHGVSRRGGNILVLDRLQDPGNLGTVLRTADGAGFSGAILMKGCGDIYSPKVVRACTGTLFRLPVLRCDTPQDALRLLRKHNKKVYATSLEKSEVYYKCDLRGDTALVIGNEGNGVCQEFIEGVDGLLTIPMAGNLESLNAAVAAGILMYETVRQRNGG